MHHVKTADFTGPLDLLLELIERGGFDISAVSLAEVTGQYLTSIESLTEPDPSTMAGFLHVASRLVLLKSRFLLRIEEPEEEEGEVSLEEQLREYQRYRDLAGELAHLEEQGSSLAGRIPAPITATFVPISPEEYAILGDLYQALVARRLPLPEPETIPLQRFSLAEQAQRLDVLLESNRRLDLTELFQECRSRLELVVTFLAVLEVLKRRTTRVWQEQAFGTITLEVI